MEWTSELTVSQWTGLIGGALGTLVGLAAGAYALRNSLRAATSPTQRRRMWLFAGVILAFVSGFLVVLAVAPSEMRVWLFVPYVVFLCLFIAAANRYAFAQARDRS